MSEQPEEPRVEVPTGPTAYQLIRRALLHPGRGQISAAVLLVVLGIAGVTQVRIAGSDDEYAGMRQADLVQALNGLQAASRRNEQDIRELEDTRDSLKDNNEKTSAALNQARDELAALAVLAGTATATGPGVRITVTVAEGGTVNLNNLLDGIEELRDAGAEAMEINDAVRVVAQTSFETAENGIKVDGTVLTAPFVIDAIGDPDSLATALRFPGGFVDSLKVDHAEAHIKKRQKIEITVLHQAAAPRYAESPQGQ